MLEVSDGIANVGAITVIGLFDVQDMVLTCMVGTCYAYGSGDSFADRLEYHTVIDKQERLPSLDSSKIALDAFLMSLALL